ncbi:MAG TPA: hypothetical protein VEF53_18720 [Patescibacteria group bacterium]|nr:hypothetical protein [Patescibacteria group bacterium]
MICLITDMEKDNGCLYINIWNCILMMIYFMLCLTIGRNRIHVNGAEENLKIKGNKAFVAKNVVRDSIITQYGEEKQPLYHTGYYAEIILLVVNAENLKH